MRSLIVPVYNEEDVIPHFFERLSSVAKTWNEDYEVVFVDDGSADSTPDLIRNIHDENPNWKVIRLSRNFGHQAAISAGLFYCKGESVAIMDVDLQDPPEELDRLFGKIAEGYDVVYAVRTKRKEGIFKRIAYKLYYRVLRKLSSIDMPLDAGDFCVMSRPVVDVLKSLPERNRFVRGLRRWAGFKQCGLEYDRPSRYAGREKYDLGRLFRLAWDGILMSSNAPLRIASFCGMLACLLSVLLVVLLVVWRYSDLVVFGMRPRDASGWTSIVALILFLAGIQFLVTGILGEYIAAIYKETKRRPIWIVAEAIGIAVAAPFATHSQSAVLPGSQGFAQDCQD